MEGPAEVIDLLYSETEHDLRESVRSMLADRCAPAGILARCEGDEPYDPKLWRTLAVEMGLAGLLVDAEHGGAGASLREAAVVVEELGRAVAPTQFLGSAVVATTVVQTVGDRQLLTELASGARSAAVAMPFSTSSASPIGAGVNASGGTLSGTMTSVADALSVDVLLVRAGDELYAVDATAAGVTRTAVVSLDLTRRLCDITLDAAPARLIGSGSIAATAVAAGLRAGTALLASEQIGIADWCLSTTVDYLLTRYQFGRPLGGYQALKHRMADLWVGLTQGRAVARYAAVCAAESDPDTAVAISLAQAHCGPLAVLAAEECVQMHGGIGFTWEHPAHLYLKRAKADAIAFGTADAHRQLLAGLVDLPGPIGA